MSSIPFKVVDFGRDIRMGLTASSMTELVDRVRYKFEIDLDLPIRIVLEQDGTEIEESDNDYFMTLEPDTPLMVLRQGEKWTPYKAMLSLGLPLESAAEELILQRSIVGGGGSGGEDSTPSSPVEELVWRLHQDLSLFPWLTAKELETIANMNTEEMRRVIPDAKFLDFLQDLSERYLQDKGSSSSCSSSEREQQLMKLQQQRDRKKSSSSGYNSNSSTDSSSSFSSVTQSSSSVVHDPIKLIRMYSKTNHYLYSPNSHSYYNGPPNPAPEAVPRAFRTQ